MRAVLKPLKQYCIGVLWYLASVAVSPLAGKQIVRGRMNLDAKEGILKVKYNKPFGVLRDLRYYKDWS